MSLDMYLQKLDKKFNQESKFSEYKDAMKKYVNVKSKAKTLEFSGTHYLGYTYTRPKTTTQPAANTAGDQSKYATNSGGFEMRRNYVQVKGYFTDKYSRLKLLFEVLSRTKHS